jgi:hemoglobin-like flavoprotein
MPALASLEELKEVDARVKEFQAAFPEAYGALAELLKKHRKVGYKNVAKLLLNESTPEKLKNATE